DFGARPEDGGFDLYHFDSAAYQLMGERFAAAFLTLAPGGGTGGAGQSGAAGAGTAGAGTAGAIGTPAGAGGTGVAGAPAGASGSSNGGSPDDDDGGCSVGATRAAPFVAFLSVALATLGLLRRRQRRG
ncbi:MAG TPA: hypothetical protein VFS00_05855, partial [Polyangiaceae bacterium]|nr:hypothetical protein [Polyangiaceae bacterium]